MTRKGHLPENIFEEKILDSDLGDEPVCPKVLYIGWLLNCIRNTEG